MGYRPGTIEGAPSVERRAEERSAAAAVLAQLFSPQRAMRSTTYRYDDRGRQIERGTSMCGISSERTTWEYDEHDNTIRELEESASGDLQADESGNLRWVNEKAFRREVRYEYKYDLLGNWTERVVSVRYEMNPDFQRSNIEGRETSYYISNTR